MKEKLLDNSARYGLVSKLFHWGMAFLLIAALILGFVMHNFSGEERFFLIKNHKILGVCIFILALMRVFWRFYQRGFLPYDNNHQVWQNHLSNMVFWVFYTLILLMPLSGYFMTISKGYGVSLFGWSLPVIWGKDKILASLFHELHEIGGWVFLVLVLLHTGAFLWHLFSKTLNKTRML